MFNIVDFRLPTAPLLKFLWSALFIKTSFLKDDCDIGVVPLPPKGDCNSKVISLADVVQSHIEGDSLFITVRPEDTNKITRLNGASFAGAPLFISISGATDAVQQSAECDTPRTTNLLRDLIDRRYDGEGKLLDLSALSSDPVDNSLTLLDGDSQSRRSRFFPALMKVCEEIFPTREERNNAVISVTLANNDLSSVDMVTTLAKTFSSIQNLDLSNNKLQDLEALHAWRWSFPHLKTLRLAGNPLEREIPANMGNIKKWYADLIVLDDTQVRSIPEAKHDQPDKRNGPPLPVAVCNFDDPAGVGIQFITSFFPTYDSDRTACIGSFYDEKSTFSLSINTAAPTGTQFHKAAGWDELANKSRNLIRVTQLPAKVSRLYTGGRSIEAAWLKLPPTRHPSLQTECDKAKWCIECNYIPGLPDPALMSAAGVTGIVIMVHGEFDEFNTSMDKAITRSFDRTFVLGPGGARHGFRVVCDTLILRGYAGSDAWKPEVGDYVVAHPVQPAMQLQSISQIPPYFSLPVEGKSELQLQKENLTIEFSRRTRMLLAPCWECLESNGWSIEAAYVAFIAIKVLFLVDNLP